MEFTIGIIEILFTLGVNAAFMLGGMYMMLKNLITRVDKHEERLDSHDTRIVECRLSLSPLPTDGRTKKSNGY